MSEKYTEPRSESVHNIAFQQLTNNLNPLLEEGCALEMPQLLKTYKCYLQENNYEHFDSYTTQKLKRLLQQYGSSIIVANCINTTQSVCNSNIHIHTTLNTAANYNQMLHDTDLMNVTDSDEKLLRRAAEILLKDIGKVEGIEINPLNPENISNTAVEELIPETLKSFLNHIRSNRDGNDKKVLSIAQDIIALQSNGRKKMPKQVGLGRSMKNAIRSKEFIKYLNSLSHCISYDTVL